MRRSKCVLIFFALIQGPFLTNTITTLNAKTSIPVIDESFLLHDNLPFFKGNDDSVYFVDFEAINLNLSDIIITNSGGEVVYEDELQDLPNKSIYEIDFNSFGPGEYLVEIRSFTEILKETVLIK